MKNRLQTVSWKSSRKRTFFFSQPSSCAIIVPITPRGRGGIIGGIMKQLAKYRRVSQYAFGGIVLYVFTAFPNGITLILAASVILGIVFGKQFCKWMCPIGLFMEFMTRNMSSDEAKLQMYNYYKLGCPIAWIQGFLNKFSLFKIKRDSKACISCGLCDKACYISSLNTEMSLYKSDKTDSSTAYSCSKCLACVSACPNGSLDVKLK